MDRSNAPQLDWKPGEVPVSRRFADPYYALSDGAAESAHVFLGGNDLPARYAPGFRIAELGFGTGLNLMVAWAAWDAAGIGAPLHFTSFEAYPMRAADIARALARWPEHAERAAAFLESYAAGGQVTLPGLVFTLVEGDARTTLPGWSGQADAWFLDGFSPARNPQMWEPALLAQVHAHTAPGGSFATYSAAGHVRRALAAAGFDVTRTRGFGHKRHMCRGTRT